MTTANTPITAGDATGGRVATYTFTEDALTKLLQRISINKSDGTEIDWTTGAAGAPAGGVSSVQGVSGMTPFATAPLPATPVSGTSGAAITDTTDHSILAAPGVGLRNYITSIIVSNSHATVDTEVVLKDGAAGAVLATIPAAHLFSGAAIPLPTPLKQPTTNTAMFAANLTTGSATKVTLIGFSAA